jgi:tetratricopeptide (TPR) repeat protein
LWKQLIADNGRVENPDLALAQARGDLQRLPVQPLICLDEIDVIYTETDLQTTSQLQIREFVNGLNQVAPLLLIGLHPPPADAHYPIQGITLSQTADFLTTAGLNPTPDELAQVYSYTDGNLRLLHLCLALQKSGLSLTEASARLPHAPALQTLWSRLWQRLLSDERAFLQRLCVFRGRAPIDAWDEPDVVSRLQQQRLIQQDDGGGIAVLPIVRDLLYNDGQRFPIALRERFHLAAAEVRTARGEFTAAAYHYHLAGEAAFAIQVWFPQRQHEVSRGYGSAALRIFQQISGRDLTRPDQEALALIQAKLFQLHGDPEAGLAAIRNVTWEGESETAVQAALLRGTFYNALGYPHRALEKYEEGMSLATGLLNQLVHFHYQRGVTHIQQRNLDQAWQEAQSAQYEAAHLQAIVKEESGTYTEAVTYYEQALRLAAEANFEPGLARTHRELSKTWGRMAQLDKAIHHGEEALRYFGHIGDRLSQEKMNSSMAAHYFQAGRFAEVIEIAVPTIAFFESANMPYWTAVTGSTLAEAYYETGRLEEATATAHKVLSLEETHTQPYAYYTLGLVARASEEFEQSETYFRHSQQVAAENGDRYLEAYAWRALGDLLLAQDKLADGRAAMQTALQQFETLGMAQEAATTQQMLASLNG